jgi:hypothetical protein
MKIIAIALAITLFTASGATAAFVVTSANIKNGTIQPVDLSAKTKRVMRGARGPAGPRGAEGIPGERGPQGPQGPGFQNVDQAQSPPVQVNDGAEGTAIATCATGLKLTGGGFWASDPSLAAYVSQPWGQGWKVVAFNFGSTPHTLYAFALCASS